MKAKKIVIGLNIVAVVFVVYTSTIKTQRLNQKVKSMQQINTKLSTENQLLRNHNLTMKKHIQNIQKSRKIHG